MDNRFLSTVCIIRYSLCLKYESRISSMLRGMGRYDNLKIHSSFYYYFFFRKTVNSPRRHIFYQSYDLEADGALSVSYNKSCRFW